MRKLVPILLVLILTMCSMTHAEDMTEDTDLPMYVLCAPDDVVNVRSAPTTRASRAGYLDCGDRIMTDGIVKKDGRGRTWYHVTEPCFEYADVWVCGMYVQETPVTTEQCYGFVIAKGRTALRRSPGGKRIKWLSNGDEVTIVAMSDEWVLTTIGYVRRDCLDIYYP